MLFTYQQFMGTYWLVLPLLILTNNAHSEIKLKRFDQSTQINRSKFTNANYCCATVGNYDGGRRVSYFMNLLDEKNHRIWWDTGLIIPGSTLGYRYAMQQSYVNQNWLIGAYAAYDLHAAYYEKGRKDEVYRFNVGAELFGSRFGQLSVNVYQLPTLKTNILGFIGMEQFNWNTGHQQLFSPVPLTVMDNYGISIKWTTIPHQSSLQGSIVLGLAWIQFEGDHGYWPRERVDRFGVGLKYVLSNYIDIEVQYMLLDTYQRGWRVGMKIRNTVSQYHENFSAQLNNPAERHISSYRAC